MLPAERTPIIGRAHLAATVIAHLTAAPIGLLTLVGPGGAGKTRLALYLAHQLAPLFPGGVSWWGLDDLDPAAVAASLTAALAPAGEPPRLVVLDGADGLGGEAARLAETLAAQPRLTVCCTGRQALGVYGEQRVTVPPLPVAALDPLPPVAELLANPAIALLVAGARRHHPAFALTPDNAAALATIAAQCDGLPLALELAAARLRLYPPAVLAAQLADPLAVLVGGRRDGPARHASLRTSLQWSYTRLPTPAQALFRALAVFPAGATLDVIARFAAALPPSFSAAARDPLDGLTTLVGAHLLWRTAEAEPRYELLPTTRAFALEQAQAADEEARLRAAYATMTAHRLAAAEAALSTAAGLAAWTTLRGAVVDGLAALDWAIATGASGLVGPLALALGTLWALTAPTPAHRAQLAVALTLADLPASALAALHLGAGRLALAAGAFQEAAHHAATALAAYRQVPDPAGETAAQVLIGQAALAAGETIAGSAAFEQALTLATLRADRAAEAAAHCGLGALALAHGDTAAARPAYTTALRQSDAAHDDLGAARARRGLARVTPDAAGPLLLAALGIAQTWGSTLDLAATVLALAGVAANAGQPRRALRFAAAARRLLAQAGAQLAPADTAGIDGALREARAALDVATAAAAGAAGERLTLDELIADATAIPSAPEPLRGRRSSSTGDAYPADLTAREVEILREVAAGLTNEQIATKLFLSTHTVQTHLRSIYSKLGGTNRTGATRFAHEHGLASPPGPPPGAARR